MHRKSQSGFSLIELAIVLGVIGFVMTGVWVVIQQGGARARVKQAVGQIIALNRSIRSFYQRQPCIAVNGDLTAALIGTNPPVILREMISGGGAVNPWNSGFQVRGAGAAGCGTAASFQFTLRYLGLQPDVCAEFLTAATSPGEAARGLAGASINGVVLTAALPPNPSAIIGNAAGQCGQNAAATVDLIYNLRAIE